ncbi:MAG TPA: hypothetical protein QF761_09435, partial [Pirellulales bacterium]|nr:hypothetical protein [Pirellulales bacterium]
ESGVISTTQSFDFETDPTSYQLTLTVDTDEGAVNKLLNVALNETNGAPTAVTLSGIEPSLSVNSDPNSRVKLANVQISDDGVGSNTISLSGADAGYFEVDADQLFLEAGAIFSLAGQGSCLLTVSVADSSVSGSTPVTADLALGDDELDDDELDDIVSALATDWQDLFGDEGENPFSGL